MPREHYAICGTRSSEIQPGGNATAPRRKDCQIPRATGGIEHFGSGPQLDPGDESLGVSRDELRHLSEIPTFPGGFRARLDQFNVKR